MYFYTALQHEFGRTAAELADLLGSGRRPVLARVLHDASSALRKKLRTRALEAVRRKQRPLL